MTVAANGNIGIGTTSPESKLHIYESSASNPSGLMIGESTLSSANSLAGFRLSTWSDGNAYFDTKTYTGKSLNFRIGEGTQFGSNKTWMMVSGASGNIAIGTTTAQTAKLYISGGSVTDSEGSGASLNANGLFMDSDELSTTASTLYIGNSSNVFKDINMGRSLYVKGAANGFVGIGTSSPIAKLAITSYGNTTGRAFVAADSNNRELLTIFDSGNIGIGATSSNNTLTIKGSSGLRIINSTYDANLVFGASDAWKSGIRVWDNGDAEMRIWHANANGQIVLATGYNGDATTTMPTDGLFIDQNKVGIGYVSPAAATGKLLVNGNVGIGTTNPTVKLAVAGTANDAINVGGGQIGGLNSTPTNNDHAVSLGYLNSIIGNSFLKGGNSFGSVPTLGTNDSYRLDLETNNAVRMTIASNGNVGIGTTNPQNLFSITKSGGLAIFDVTSYNTSLNNRAILFFRTALGSESSPADVASGNMLGEFIGSGYAGGSFRNVAGMNFAVGSGTVSASSLPSYIYFETTPNLSVTRVERLRITQDGNVGIGTTAPGAKLQVAGDLLLSGTGKLTANTIDPPYLIEGRKYATYMAGMTGVKEETTGVVTLRPAADKTYYYHILDIARAEEGSDLWLFSRTANLKQNGLDAVTVLLAPSFSGRVWYEKDSAKQTITIKASGLKALKNPEVSYRLSAPRFDFMDYGNRRPDSDPYEGLNLDKLLK